MIIHPHRLFSAEPRQRDIAIALYETVKDLPIVSPHGHTDPSWFAHNRNFDNASDLLIIPDHYVFRMLMSQGIQLSDLGISQPSGGESEMDKRAIWRLFAKHYYLFRGTPSNVWMDYVFHFVFGLEQDFSLATADQFYDHINAKLATEAFKPRALLDKFSIEIIATTEGGLDPLKHHQSINKQGWGHRVVTTFRPDDIVDASDPNFSRNIERLAEITGCDTETWGGYLDAIRHRRQFFKDMGARATDHGHPSARTADLNLGECESLFKVCLSGKATDQQAELFRAQMLTELAGMSVDDGLVMQIHPGCYRNHNTPVYEKYGRDKGGDIPLATEYVKALQPLLAKYGNEPNLSIIVFTLDESNYARELAPLAGHYPALKLGPAWWFHDSVEGMLRYRKQVTETAGFYNTVGFNDDTRALLSIPARHDVARRIDCRYLAYLVAEHRLDESAAFELALDLSYKLAKQAYFGGHNATS